MKFNALVTGLILLTSSTVVIANNVLSMTTNQRPNMFYKGQYVTELNITSDVDLLEIYTVNINRGNCKVRIIKAFGEEMARTLKFGETTTYQIENCNVREVSVETNHGVITRSKSH